MKNKIFLILSFLIVALSLILLPSNTLISYAETTKTEKSFVSLNIGFNTIEDNSYCVFSEFAYNADQTTVGYDINSYKITFNVNGVSILPAESAGAEKCEIYLNKGDTQYEIFSEMEYEYYKDNDLIKNTIKSETITLNKIETATEALNETKQTNVEVPKAVLAVTLPVASAGSIALLSVYLAKASQNFLLGFKLSFKSLNNSIKTTMKLLEKATISDKKKTKLYKKLLKKISKLIRKNVSKLKEKNIETLGQYNTVIVDCANIDRVITAAEKTLNSTTPEQQQKVLQYITNKTIPNAIQNMDEVNSTIMKMKNMNSKSVSHKNQLKLNVKDEEYMDFLKKNIFDQAEIDD